MPSTKHIRRCFTLVELLISMTILTVIMMMLMQFLMAIQSLWNLNAASNRMFEGSRLVFDVLERDLRASVTSSIIDKQIGFYIGTPDTASAGDCLHVCFVSASDPHTNANSRLGEIGYKYHQDRTTVNPTIPPFTLARQVVCDDDLGGNWNFTGRPANWHVNNTLNAQLAEFEKIVGGVADFRITCYDRNNTIIAAGTDTIEMPHRIEIYLLLFDEALVDLPESERFKTQRAFTKILYLGDLQTE